MGYGGSKIDEIHYFGVAMVLFAIGTVAGLLSPAGQAP
jgi:hypothetical protein